MAALDYLLMNSMPEQLYEPFGEALGRSSILTDGRHEGSSAAVYAGIVLFWILTLTIVAARALWLDTDIGNAFLIAKACLHPV